MERPKNSRNDSGSFGSTIKESHDNAITSETIRKLRELYSAEKLADGLNPSNSTSNPQQNTMTSTVSSSNSIIAAP